MLQLDAESDSMSPLLLLHIIEESEAPQIPPLGCVLRVARREVRADDLHLREAQSNASRAIALRRKQVAILPIGVVEAEVIH